MMTLNKMLYPTDFSPAAEQAFCHGNTRPDGTNAVADGQCGRGGCATCSLSRIDPAAIPC